MKCRLKDITTKIGSGATPLGGERAYKTSGISLIRSLNVHDDGFCDKDLARIDEIQAARLANVVVAPNDVLLNITGASVARCCLAPQHFLPARVNQHVSIIRPIQGKLGSKFLYYLLTSKLYKDRLLQTGEDAGATRQAITKAQLEDFSVEFPEDLPEQQRIVGILDEAFDGIATAMANVEKNLQNARALFESHLQSVFTQRGEGWVEKTLGDTYDVRDGTHDSPKYQAIGHPLITSKNLKRAGLSFDNVSLISEQDYRKINERSAVHLGDVLFAMIGTIGAPTLVEVEPHFAIKNVALFKIPSDQSGPFLKYYLSTNWVISRMEGEAKGATQKFVGLGYLRSFPIWVPTFRRQINIVQALDRLSAEIQRLEALYRQKLAALDELKKSVLHQAFSGQL
ncbi:MAG: restriction endonuclease subunit S [Bryobacteraceae bacterium]